MACQEHLPQAYFHHQAANDHSILCAALSTDPGEENKNATQPGPLTSHKWSRTSKKREKLFTTFPQDLTFLISLWSLL